MIRLTFIGTMIVAAICASAPEASGVALLAWDFGGNTGNETTVAATTVVSGFLSGTITRGPGLTADNPVANTFTAQNWDLGATESTAHSAGDYIELTLTPGPEVISWSISSIQARMLTLSNASPHLVAWRRSTNGFSGPSVLFDMGEFPNGAVTTVTSILSSIPTLQNLNGAITLRFICYDADSTTAHLDFGFGTTDGNDLTINGTFMVPEPGAATLVALGGISIGLACRRRRGHPSPPPFRSCCAVRSPSPRS